MINSNIYFLVDVLIIYSSKLLVLTIEKIKKNISEILQVTINSIVQVHLSFQFKDLSITNPKYTRMDYGSYYTKSKYLCEFNYVTHKDIGFHVKRGSCLLGKLSY